MTRIGTMFLIVLLIAMLSLALASNKTEPGVLKDIPTTSAAAAVADDTRARAQETRVYVLESEVQKLGKANFTLADLPGGGYWD